MRTCLVALLAFLSSSAGAQQPKQPPSSPQHEQPQVHGSGKMPDGWKVRFDDAAAKPDAVEVEAKDDTLTVTTGPAGIYYKPGMKAEKDYELTAVFSQLKPSEHAEGYGLFIAGQDLDKETQRYTYFLVRQDGRFLIKSRNGAAVKAIVDWTAAPSMREPKGVKTSNTLQIRATEDTVRFFINDKQVHKLTRMQAGGDGIAGVRVNHNLNVQVGKLTLKKLE
jgi:hypothetical protein